MQNVTLEETGARRYYWLTLEGPVGARLVVGYRANGEVPRFRIGTDWYDVTPEGELPYSGECIVEILAIMPPSPPSALERAVAAIPVEPPHVEWVRINVFLRVLMVDGVMMARLEKGTQGRWFLSGNAGSMSFRRLVEITVSSNSVEGEATRYVLQEMLASSRRLHAVREGLLGLLSVGGSRDD